MPLGLLILHLKGQPVLDSLVQAYLFKLSDNPLTHAGFSSNTLGTFLILGSARTHINTLSPRNNADTLLAEKNKFPHFDLLSWQIHHIYMPTQIEKKKGAHGKWKGIRIVF